TIAITDCTPPAAVTDLSADASSCTEITVTWTAPGDDGNVGTATAYDLRWSSSIIDTDAKFNAAHPIRTAAPSPAGSPERATQGFGECSGARYFAIKTRDEVPNWSPLAFTPLRAQTPCIQPPQQCVNGKPVPISATPDVTMLSSVSPNPAISGI